MLVVKIELEKNKESYQAVLKALEGLDILSASWEDESVPVQTQISATAPKGEADLASKVSAAVNRIENNRH